jgi:hypothetical protein
VTHSFESVALRAGFSSFALMVSRVIRLRARECSSPGGLVRIAWE